MRAASNGSDRKGCGRLRVIATMRRDLPAPRERLGARDRNDFYQEAQRNLQATSAVEGCRRRDGHPRWARPPQRTWRAGVLYFKLQRLLSGEHSAAGQIVDRLLQTIAANLGDMTLEDAVDLIHPGLKLLALFLGELFTTR